MYDAMCDAMCGPMCDAMCDAMCGPMCGVLQMSRKSGAYTLGVVPVAVQLAVEPCSRVVIPGVKRGKGFVGDLTPLFSTIKKVGFPHISNILRYLYGRTHLRSETTPNNRNVVARGNHGTERCRTFPAASTNPRAWSWATVGAANGWWRVAGSGWCCHRAALAIAPV